MDYKINIRIEAKKIIHTLINIILFINTHLQAIP